MGSYIEINDTLQLTSQQGFPDELILEKHLQKPFTAIDFKDRIFEFTNKPDIRIFHIPPVRVFFAHNIEGKWLYWGAVEIIELTLDYVNKTTSGKYRIIKINSPDEMKQAEQVLHFSRPDTMYFGEK
jgi:hypothetical protein